jgi:hypothetical protein
MSAITFLLRIGLRCFSDAVVLLQLRFVLKKSTNLVTALFTYSGLQ